MIDSLTHSPTFAIYGRTGSQTILPYVSALINELRDAGIGILIYQPLASFMKQNGVPVSGASTFSTHDELDGKANFLFSLGGDGTLLDTITLVRDHGIPIVGINTGRLGFLASISKDRLKDCVESLLQGRYDLDRRSLIRLETPIPLFGQVNYALNEITIHKKDSSSMIIIHTYLNGEYLNSYWADGLIISTPTGSTAYALSGGGPILHPSMDAIALVPMHPHTLSSRPIVVGGHSEVKITIRENRVLPMVSADGQHSVSLNVGDSLHIRKHPFKLSLLHPPGYDFYMACRTKLGWNQDFESFQRDES